MAGEENLGFSLFEILLNAALKQKIHFPSNLLYLKSEMKDCETEQKEQQECGLSIKLKCQDLFRLIGVTVQVPSSII